MIFNYKNAHSTYIWGKFYLGGSLINVILEESQKWHEKIWNHLADVQQYKNRYHMVHFTGSLALVSTDPDSYIKPSPYPLQKILSHILSSHVLCLLRVLWGWNCEIIKLLGLCFSKLHSNLGCSRVLVQLVG